MPFPVVSPARAEFVLFPLISSRPRAVPPSGQTPRARVPSEDVKRLSYLSCFRHCLLSLGPNFRVLFLVSGLNAANMRQYLIFFNELKTQEWMHNRHLESWKTLKEAWCLSNIVFLAALFTILIICSSPFSSKENQFFKNAYWPIDLQKKTFSEAEDQST